MGIGEIILAALLLPGVTRRLGCIATAAFGTAIVVLVALALSRRRRFPCACFGVSGEVGGRTLARGVAVAFAQGTVP